MRKTLMVCFVVCAALFIASCATLFQGTNEEVMVASDPPGAQVTVNDGRSGVTPYSMRVSRDEDLQIHVAKPGYAPYDQADTSHVEWGYVVSDFFFTGLIGLAVDGMDGAIFYHDNNMVTVHLEPLPGTNSAPSVAGTAPGNQSMAVATGGNATIAAKNDAAIASDQKLPAH